MKKILSIDGGGIRGLIPALVLAEIEARCGKPASSCFDLIAGTSTGGILAMGLALGQDAGGGKRRPRYAASDLADLYRARGKDIFSRSLWKRISSGNGLAEEIYSASGLEKTLKTYFGEARLSSALTRVLVSAYDIEARNPLFFKSWRPEYDAVMREAARATSAAPTYFEPALIPVNNEKRALVDGGIFLNSPAVSAYAEALRLFPDEKDFFLLSLGTGELAQPYAYKEAKDWGLISWMEPLIGCMMDGMADACDYQMRLFLGDRYVRLQTTLEYASEKMDDASAQNVRYLEAEAARLISLREGDLRNICALL